MSLVYQQFTRAPTTYSGVAAGWTQVDTSIPLLPEAGPVIDEDPVSVEGQSA